MGRRLWPNRPRHRNGGPAIMSWEGIPPGTATQPDGPTGGSIGPLGCAPVGCHAMPAVSPFHLLFARNSSCLQLPPPAPAASPCRQPLPPAPASSPCRQPLPPAPAASPCRQPLPPGSGPCRRQSRPWRSKWAVSPHPLLPAPSQAGSRCAMLCGSTATSTRRPAPVPGRCGGRGWSGKGPPPVQGHSLLRAGPTL
jgi:hypothetical protein